MSQTERRIGRRLPLRLCISGSVKTDRMQEPFWGSTEDISATGFRFLTGCGSFRPGMFVWAELYVPPRTGVFDSGGWIFAHAEVRRTECASSNGCEGDGSTVAYEVAVRFRQRPICMPGSSLGPGSREHLYGRTGHINTAVDSVPNDMQIPTGQ